MSNNELDLNGVRNIIDECDKKIIELLEKRLDIVYKVAEYKLKNNMEIFDGGRESVVLDKVGANVKNTQYIPFIKDIYTGIMYSSKNYQKRLIDEHIDCGNKLYDGAYSKAGSKTNSNINGGLRVAYQGVPGSYGEEAMLMYFGADTDAVNYRSFEEVAAAVVSGEVSYGILPIENSYTGSVTASLDLLAKEDLYITGEYILPVRHNLMAKKGAKISDIKEVYSHEQGLLQCSEFLKGYPDWAQIEYVNTAISAKMVAESEENYKAAISGRRAAEIYGLDILVENINQSDTNSTRFIIFSKNSEISEKANKISIMFSLPHRSGTLFEAMKLITGQGLNLLKIESRPLRMANWEYLFFIDFEGNISGTSCEKALSDLKNTTGTFRFLGNYMRDNKSV